MKLKVFLTLFILAYAGVYSFSEQKPAEPAPTRVDSGKSALLTKPRLINDI